AGMEEKALSVAKRIGDPDLRGRAQLAVLKNRLEKSKSEADESLLQLVEKNTPAHGLALEIWARHNARLRPTEAQKSVERWESEGDRRFGYIGIVLGLQDAGR